MARPTLKEAATANLALRRLKGDSISDIADEIVMISHAIHKLRATRLTEETLLLLIQSAADKHRGKPIATKIIKAVIDGIDNLETKHLKPKEKAR